MKRLFSLLIIVLLVVRIYAYDTQINGIYYNLNHDNKTAIVTHDGSIYDNNGAGYTQSKIVIPTEIYHNNTKYSVNTIDWHSFYNCSTIESIVLPNSITTIKSCAFENCISLIHLILPNSVIEMGSSVFANCSSLSSIKLSNNIKDIEYKTFENCKSLSAIIIPNGVIYIRSEAFKNCLSLKSIIIPTSVIEIESYAFYKCSSLNYISIANTTKIDMTSFGGTQWLYSQPNGCFYLNNILYTHKGDITENMIIKVKEGTKQIAGSAFNGRSYLTSIILPNGLEIIGSLAFAGCSALNTITIPSSVTEVGSGAFDNCTSLQSIICLSQRPPSQYVESSSMMEKLISGGVMFYFEEEITERCVLKIPKGTKELYVNHNVWGRFKNIEEIDIIQGKCGNNVKYQLNNNGVLDIFGYGELYDKINFDFKQKIKEVSISDKIISIGINTFLDCKNLRIVKIGNSIEKIEDGAFNGCENILSITIMSELPPIISENTLNGVMRNIEIKVPKNAIKYYKTAKYWNQFTNYTAIE